MYYSVEGWPQADALVLPMVAMHDPVEGWPQAGAFVVGACEEKARADAADGVVVLLTPVAQRETRRHLLVSAQEAVVRSRVGSAVELR